MNRHIVRNPQAQQEIEDIAFFLSRQNPDVGFRFLEAVEQTLGLVASMPGIGSAYPSKSPHLVGLRCSQVAGFRKFLVFYRPIEDGIEVMRVLHGARNISALLEGEGAG